MSTFEAFEIDDDFDPLAEAEFVPEEEDDQAGADYLPPIPDADKSVVPAAVQLTPQQKIEKLLEGIPGQKFRLRSVVDACREPAAMEDIAATVDQAFPTETSVYGTVRLIRLLEQAEAICQQPAQQPEAEAQPRGQADQPAAAPDGAQAKPAAEGEPTYLEVADGGQVRFVATPEGRAFADDLTSEAAVRMLWQEEPRYLPLYRMILQMCAQEGGAATKDLDLQVDPDPLCQEPKRFCGYFRSNLEDVGALIWRNAWITTPLGQQALATIQQQD